MIIEALHVSGSPNVYNNQNSNTGIRMHIEMDYKLEFEWSFVMQMRDAIHIFGQLVS